jgi:hypothetical protein
MRPVLHLILATSLAVPAYAQSTTTGRLEIKADVVCPLVLAVSHPLEFGRLLTSTTKTVAPGAATGGRFELYGQGGSAVTVTLSMPSELTPPVGSNLPITAWTYIVSNAAGLTGTAVSFNSGTSDPIAVSFSDATGSTKMYFGIGATVSASGTQPATQYTGNGQIIASYADL